MTKGFTTKKMTEEQYIEAKAKLTLDNIQIGDYIAEKLLEYLESKEK